MATKANRFCNHPGCGELVASGYCPTHKPAYDAERDAIKKAYARQRGNTRKLGYTSDWDRLRVVYRSRHPLCELCEGRGVIRPAELVHHVRHIADGGAVLETDNLMSLCRDCHESIHGADRFKKRSPRF